MKMKILKVKNCKKCPAQRIDHEWDNNVYKYVQACELSNYRKIYSNMKSFPDWCPLEDYNNGNK